MFTKPILKNVFEMFNKYLIIILFEKQELFFLKDENRDYLLLNVLNCDMKDSIGPPLKMLPKFGWRSEILTKNTIDLLAIIDFCIFDSNMRLIESTR